MPDTENLLFLLTTLDWIQLNKLRPISLLVTHDMEHNEYAKILQQARSKAIIFIDACQATQ